MSRVARYLPIYLNDHLFGATVGRELARRAAKNNADNELGRFLDELAREVDADRNTLLEVMEALGVKQSTPKVAAGWVAEKAGRLKLNGELVRYSPLSRVVELEGLAGGILAKRELWRSLATLEDERLARFDFEHLAGRADEQREAVEERRVDAARFAFAR